MAFYMPYTVRHSEAPLANLLRLVDDLNTFPGSSSGCRSAYRTPRAAPRPWHPHFDARETQDSYVLRGELPGLNRDHVTIEFPEAQKIVISGKVVEDTPEGPAAVTTTTEQNSTATTATVDQADDAAMSEETESRSSYQATVEDDDEDDFEVVGESSKKQEKQPVVEPKLAAKQPEERRPQAAEERILRQFSRTFTFSSPVEYDFVTASLKDGLLEVVVPKLKHQPHQVIVN